jgi:hypothetical protein
MLNIFVESGVVHKWQTVAGDFDIIVVNTRNVMIATINLKVFFRRLNEFKLQYFLTEVTLYSGRLSELMTMFSGSSTFAVDTIEVRNLRCVQGVSFSRPFLFILVMLNSGILQ